ncbi:ferredoxin reductase family protein [Roseobacter sp. YSTF-M11]|uniref:Ferredoxin reductase family protein n=1 Tax=Roseobacter insulae TaxID=2859783 RepID=A0A9X1FSB7_9RHOB|nr:ferredoxin reductase family protein [Roseobacter insulae]MBW4706210.1 ferredoxin reductase family protein [Roseobacter insulae]
MRAYVLIPLYLFVVCLPVLLSWASGMPARSFRNDLASGLGLLAFAMILVEFVLSGRFRSVSSGLGLDITIRFHQLVARTALAFALVHPFLYQWLPGPSRPWDPTRQLTLTSDFVSLLSGILAFVLLPAFVLLSMKHDDLDYRYETWRLIHGLGALLIAGLLLHHALSAGRYSADPMMIWMWGTMTAIAAFSLLAVYVLKPAYQAAHRWRVSSVARLTPRQWGVTITPDGHAGTPYKAGQFVWLNIGHSPFSLRENPFSISSAPSAGPDMSFVIKELGDFTSTLDQIEIGEKAYIDGPHGTLTVDGRDEPGIALIAGGVGIAPLIGILRDLHLAQDARQRVLVYGNRAEEQIVFQDEIDRLAKSENTQVVYVLQEPPDYWFGPSGLIDAGLITRTFDKGQFGSWLFVLCGPTAMMTSVEEALMEHGVAPDRILSERFQYD